MRRLSAEELELVDLYFGSRILKRLKHKFGTAGSHTLLWHAHLRMRAVEMGLYVDLFGDPVDTLRRQKIESASRAAKIFLDHLSYVRRSITTMEKSYLRKKIGEGITGDDSLNSIAFEIRMFNHVDKTNVRRIRFSEAFGEPGDLEIETDKTRFHAECKSLQGQMAIEKCLWYYQSLIDQVHRRHQPKIASSRAFFSIQIRKPLELKSLVKCVEVADIIGKLYEGPFTFEHPNVRLLEWIHPPASLAELARITALRFESDPSLDMEVNYPQLVVPSYQNPYSCCASYVEVGERGLKERVSDVCSYASTQLASRFNPVLLVNLEEAEIDPWPQPVDQDSAASLARSDQCWEVIERRKQQDQFAFVGLYESFPAVRSVTEADRIISRSRFHLRRGSAPPTRCSGDQPPFVQEGLRFS